MSSSAANATCDLNITWGELYRYKFITPVFLKTNITGAFYCQSSNEVGVRLIIQSENLIPIINLQAANLIEFQVDGENKSFAFYRYYSSDLEYFVYELRYPENPDPSPVTVIISVVDFRGIKVRGRVDNLNLEEINA